MCETFPEKSSDSRALVVGGGIMRGAYSAGALSVLEEELGPRYFSDGYGSSVGVFALTYFAGNQVRAGMPVWENFVHGRQLINTRRLVGGEKPAIDLDYLVGRFQAGPTRLDVDAVLNGPMRLHYAVTKANGERVYLRPTRETIFEGMKASSSFPVFCPPVEVQGESLVDGGLTDPFPVKKALEDGHRKVLCILNDNGSSSRVLPHTFRFIAKRKLSPVLASLVEKFSELWDSIDRVMEECAERIVVISPREPLPLKNSFDTDQGRIRATIEMGIRDARAALKSSAFL